MKNDAEENVAIFPKGIHNVNWHDVSDVKRSCFSKRELTCYVALVTSRPAVMRLELALSVTDVQARESDLNTSEVLTTVTISADGCSQFGL